MCPDKKSEYWAWHLQATPGECRYPHCCKNHHEEPLSQTISNEEIGLEWSDEIPPGFTPTGVKFISEPIKDCHQCKQSFPIDTVGLKARIYGYLNPEQILRFMNSFKISDKRENPIIATDYWVCSEGCKDILKKGSHEEM